MQIQFKQDDITAALKGYIAGQGISLNNKSFGVAFKAGRKGSGLSAMITINDVPLMATPVPVEEPKVEAPTVVEAVPVPEPKPAATTSLFG
jgi:hypothetical protein